MTTPTMMKVLYLNNYDGNENYLHMQVIGTPYNRGYGFSVNRPNTLLPDSTATGTSLAGSGKTYFAAAVTAGEGPNAVKFMIPAGEQVAVAEIDWPELRAYMTYAASGGSPVAPSGKPTPTVKTVTQEMPKDVMDLLKPSPGPDDDDGGTLEEILGDCLGEDDDCDDEDDLDI